jgi:AcrR family transcriptional regulator
LGLLPVVGESADLGWPSVLNGGASTAALLVGYFVGDEVGLAARYRHQLAGRCSTFIDERCSGCGRNVNMVQRKNERRSHGPMQPPARPATVLRHRDLRAELLIAADRLIETRGLAHLRARDLANQAGCSLGAIYSVFVDLDELILAVNANTLRAIDRDMTGIYSGTPLQQLAALADAYLTYAVGNRLRWEALFDHRMPAEAVVPQWFHDIQNAAFSHIEGPLALLRPDLPDAARRLLGRSIFAAIHGMVALGLDKRVAPIDLPVLRSQIALVVGAIVQGLRSIELPT